MHISERWERTLGFVRRLFRRPRFVTCAWDHPVVYEGGAAGLQYVSEGVLLVHVRGKGWYPPSGVLRVAFGKGPEVVQLTGIGPFGWVRKRMVGHPVHVVKHLAKPRFVGPMATSARQRIPQVLIAPRARIPTTQVVRVHPVVQPNIPVPRSFEPPAFNSEQQEETTNPTGPDAIQRLQDPER